MKGVLIVTELPNIGKTASNALRNVGITQLEQLTLVNAKALAKLHGVGPKAIQILETALTRNKLKFSAEYALDFEVECLVMGDLNCDNAPKRRVVLNYLLAAWLQNTEQATRYLSSAVGLTDAGSETYFVGSEKLLTAYQTTEKIVRISFHQILSHGKEAAADGSILFESGRQSYFAEFYQFEGHRKEAKLLNIRRYFQEG